MGSHYSKAFEGHKFYQSLRYAADEIVQEFENAGVGFPVLCYSGFSGTTAATVLALYISESMRVEQLYVRKPTEKCHGNPIESSSDDLSGGVPIFVDDFVSSGYTLNYVMFMVFRYLIGNIGYSGFEGFEFLDNDESRESAERQEFTGPSELTVPEVFMGVHDLPLVPHVLIGDNSGCFEKIVDIMPELWEDKVTNIKLEKN